MKNCQNFGPRFWVTHGSRADRIPMARLFLSNHRMVIETGRWKRWPRDQRICPYCKEQPAPVVSCCTRRCAHLDERCLGIESHYIWNCPATSWLWHLTREYIYGRTKLDIGENSFLPLNHIADTADLQGVTLSKGHYKLWTKSLAKFARKLLDETGDIFLPFNVASLR